MQSRIHAACRISPNTLGSRGYLPRWSLEARASVNGDESDRGLQFHSDDPSVVRIVLGKL